MDSSIGKCHGKKRSPSCVPKTPDHLLSPCCSSPLPQTVVEDTPHHIWTTPEYERREKLRVARRLFDFSDEAVAQPSEPNPQIHDCVPHEDESELHPDSFVPDSCDPDSYQAASCVPDSQTVHTPPEERLFLGQEMLKLLVPAYFWPKRKSKYPFLGWTELCLVMFSVSF